MNETSIKAKLRALIKPHCYIQSMSSLATSGTPDLWLSGRRDLWLEIKQDQTTKGAIKPDLSPLQEQWCNNRYDEGRLVMVLVATDTKTGILYQNRTWNMHGNDRRPLKEIVEYILGVVGT